MVLRMPRRRVLFSLFLGGSMLVLAAEAVLRLIGLGDPPLIILDADIEYYSKPGSYRRLGNQLEINQNFMRGEELRAKKSQKRIILLGDSIVHGTFRLNQDELISVALEERTKQLESIDVEILNIACTSWGPVNQAAFLKRFGLFEADQVIWIISSHDLTDVPVPGFATLLPHRKPLLAIQDMLWVGWRKYQARRLTQPRLRVQSTLAAIDEIVSLVRKKGIPLLVAQHLTRWELKNGVEADGERLKDEFTQRNVPVVSLKAPLSVAEDVGGAYADEIHLTAIGAKKVGVWIAEYLAQ